MREGYFLLHRKIFDNPILNVKPFCKGFAWVNIIGLANHKEGVVQVKNGTLIKIKRGECGYSEKALADLFGWSRGKVRRFLEHLKNEGMIQLKSVENRNIIRILKYEPYQTVHQKNKKTDTKQNSKRTQTINDKEYIDTNSYINISLSHEITEEERELLKKYVKENKLAKTSVTAYVNKIIKNGDHIDILKEIKKKQAKKTEQKNSIEKDYQKVKDEKTACTFALKHWGNSGENPLVQEILKKYNLQEYMTESQLYDYYHKKYNK